MRGPRPWQLSKLFQFQYEEGIRDTDILVKRMRVSRKTLIHEFLDYMISSVYKPSVNLLNLMIKGVNEEVYRRKENLIESLIKFIEPKLRREEGD